MDRFGLREARGRLALLVALALAFVFAGAGAVPARADVVIEGQKKVRRDSIVDFGPFADRAPRSYEVQPGDTVSALAEEHLGSVARQPDILEFNPGLTPESLQTGATILLPPRAADPSQWVHFFAVAWGSQLERAFHRQPLHHHHYWTNLWMVPHAHVAEFLERASVERRRRREVIRTLADEPWIAKAEARLCGYATLPEASPIGFIVETHAVRAIEEGKIVLERVAVRNLDRDREPITGSGLFFAPGNSLLLVLSACGALGLALLALRRRAATTRLEPATVA